MQIIRGQEGLEKLIKTEVMKLEQKLQRDLEQKKRYAGRPMNNTSVSRGMTKAEFAQVQGEIYGMNTILGMVQNARIIPPADYDRAEAALHLANVKLKVQ